MEQDQRREEKKEKQKLKKVKSKNLFSSERKKRGAFPKSFSQKTN